MTEADLAWHAIFY